MASKRSSRGSAAVKVKKGPLLESYRLTEDGRRKVTPPGRIHADDVLGRVHVVRRTITLHFEGEYEAVLTYEAK